MKTTKPSYRVRSLVIAVSILFLIVPIPVFGAEAAERPSECPTPTPSPTPKPESCGPLEESWDVDPECKECLQPHVHEVRRVCDHFITPVLEFSICRDGRTADHRFKRSTGCDAADALIIEYVRNWVFSPAIKNGEPVPIPHYVVIHF